MRSIFWVSLVLTFVASKRSRIFWSGSWSTIEPKTLATGLRLCDDWDLSIDLKLFMRPENRNKEKNIFGLKVSGTNGYFLDPGSRLPSLFIKKGLNYIRLYASLITSSSYSFVYGEQGNGPDSIAKGKWYTLKLSQVDGWYMMKVNDKIVHIKSNTKSQTWDNVELVMGDTYGKPNFAPAVGQYKNFEINSCETKSMTQFKTPKFSTTTKSTTSTTTTKSTTTIKTTISTTDLTTIQTTTTIALTTQMTSKISTSIRVFIINQSIKSQGFPNKLHVFIFVIQLVCFLSFL